MNVMTCKQRLDELKKINDMDFSQNLTLLFISLTCRKHDFKNGLSETGSVWNKYHPVDVKWLNVS